MGNSFVYFIVMYMGNVLGIFVNITIFTKIPSGNFILCIDSQTTITLNLNKANKQYAFCLSK